MHLQINRYKKENDKQKRLHSDKKGKDSLEDSLDRVLFAAELEFPKILVPRLPQHTSDVNTETLNALESQYSQNNCIIYKWPASWSTDTS